MTIRMVSWAFMVALSMVVAQATSDCKTGYECFRAKAGDYDIHSRKILAGFAWKKDEMEVDIVGRSSSRKNGGNSYGWELRKAPSGPDPLHHNGGGPKKPQTP